MLQTFSPQSIQAFPSLCAEAMRTCPVCRAPCIKPRQRDDLRLSSTDCRRSIKELDDTTAQVCNTLTTHRLSLAHSVAQTGETTRQQPFSRAGCMQERRHQFRCVCSLLPTNCPKTAFEQHLSPAQDHDSARHDDHGGILFRGLLAPSPAPSGTQWLAQTAFDTRTQASNPKDRPSSRRALAGRSDF